MDNGYNLVPKKYLPFCVTSTWIRQDFLIDNDIEIDLIFITLNYLNHNNFDVIVIVDFHFSKLHIVKEKSFPQYKKSAELARQLKESAEPTLGTSKNPTLSLSQSQNSKPSESVTEPTLQHGL